MAATMFVVGDIPLKQVNAWIKANAKGRSDVKCYILVNTKSKHVDTVEFKDDADAALFKLAFVTSDQKQLRRKESSMSLEMFCANEMLRTGKLTGSEYARQYRGRVGFLG